MKAWPLRAGLVLLLAATIFVRTLPDNRISDPAELPGRVNELMRARGFVRENPGIDSHEALKLMQFRMAGCPQPFVVVPISINGAHAALLAEATLPRGPREVIYADRAAPDFGRVRLKIEQFRLQALWTVGLGRYQPLGFALLLAMPEGCAIPAGIDWAKVWEPELASASAAAQ